jgi:hypothetical protein
MAKDAKPKGEEQKIDPNRYQYGAVADAFVEAKDYHSAGKSLEALAKSLKPDQDITEIFVGPAMRHQETVRESSEIANKKYNDALEALTMPEMFTRYSGALEKRLGKDSQEYTNAKELFENYGDKTYGSIKKKIASLKERKDSETDNFTQEEKDKAKEEYEKKYSDIEKLITLLEGAQVNQLSSPIRDQSITELIKELPKIKKKPDAPDGKSNK